MAEQSSSALIAVTGATGRLGGRIARRLAERGVAQRLVVRDLSRAPELAGASAVSARFEDGDAVRAALEGVTTALMVSADETPDRVEQHRTFVDAAVDAGVRHLVYTSFYGAAADATFTLARDHYATESYIRTTGLGHTFLRDNLYADFTPFMVGEDGVIRGPAGHGKAALVALDDIADAATAVLLDPHAHDAATYDLTGPEALTFAQIAETIEKVTGRPTTYHAETVEEAYRSRAVYQAPDWQVDAWVTTYTAIAAGELAGVTDHVERLIGRPATPLVDVLAA
ncbi:MULTISPECIES: SDR family oxidoreductase [unclassified Saccharothrix]|uniref:SDR family oxidoreductase n=1 Tax=unclassified Saccharothrix TaxID=2593673 RepID=UPI00307F5395